MTKSKTWFLFISLILLIILRYFSAKPVYKNGDRVRITSVVYSDPITYETSQYLKISGLKIYLPKFPEVSYGNKIVVEGIVEKDKLKSVKLISVKENVGLMSGFRNSIISFYQKVLPQPMSGLTAGIVLGSKGALSQEFYNKTKLTGVAHVVVASGTNVTFVVSFLMGVLTNFLPRRKAIYFSIIAIVLYLFISGFDAPLVRAAIMATLTFWGQLAGRMVSAWRVLIATALGMLLYNPAWVSDLGFLLSFVSTASLMLFERKIRQKLKYVPEILKEGLSTSLAAQIGVTPILFVTFGQFNLLSPVVNVLILWTVPYIMILGSIGGIIGLIVPFLGKVILYISYPLTWWFSFIVTLFSF